MGATYVLHWPLYSNAPYARWLCAAVPCAASAAFLLVGLGAVPLKALVDSATVRAGTGTGRCVDWGWIENE